MRFSARTFLRIAAALGLSIGCARAEDDRSGLVWMSADEIHQEFAGKKLAGLYPSLRPWKETINADGSTDYREGANHWMGHWWVASREFCFRYPPPGLGGCFRITRISANCFELYEFDSSAGQEIEPPRLADQWNGRMWHEDRPTTCEMRPSV